MKNKRKHNNKENKIKLGKISWLIIIAVFVICIGLIGIGFSWYSYTGGTDAGVKLGYIGNIIGSGMSMLGVIMTILFTIEMQKDADVKREQERREEFSMQYRPILQIENKKIKLQNRVVVEPLYEFDEKSEQYIEVGENKHEEKFLGVQVELKNIGRGEILNASVKCKRNDDVVQIEFEKVYRDIFPKDIFEISLVINMKNQKLLLEHDYYAEVDVNIEYYDCMNKKSEVTIPINIENFAAEYWYNEENAELVLQSENTLNCNIGNIIRNFSL